MSGVSLGIQDSPEPPWSRRPPRRWLPATTAIKMKVKKGQGHRVRPRRPRGLSRSSPSWSTPTGTTASGTRSIWPELDEFGLTMIEQPLSYSDIYQHSILQRRLKTAICLDESILEPRRRDDRHRPGELPRDQHQAGQG